MNRREAFKRIAVGAAAVPVVAEVLGRERHVAASPHLHDTRITADGRVTTELLQMNTIAGLPGGLSKTVA